jgi:hypothetical protein
MTHALTIHDPSNGLAVQRQPVGLIRPIAAPAEVLQAQEETRAMVAAILQEGRDFGVIPGTDKPSMLKPGAERTALAFGCYYGHPEIVEKEIDHDRAVDWVKRKKEWANKFKGDREFTWKEEHGTSFGLYRYVVRVPVVHRDSGQTVGYGIGSCSTMESKYIDRPRDSENTALKMAHKRAVVGGCLVTFGLSDQFTQDTEDVPSEQLVGENAPKLEPMDPPCPKCAGKMYDNRLSKKSAKQPDFKCKKKECDGVIWPPRAPTNPANAAPAQSATDETGAAPARTIEWAVAYPFPFQIGTPSHEKPMGELGTKHLESIVKWVLGKQEEKGDPTWNDEPLAAMQMVIAARATGKLKEREKSSPTPIATDSDDGGIGFADLSKSLAKLVHHERIPDSTRAEFVARGAKVASTTQLRELIGEVESFITHGF